MLRKADESDRQCILDYCKDEPSINLFIIGDIELYGFNQTFQEVWIQTETDTNGEMTKEITGIVLRYHQNFIIYGKEFIKADEIVALLKNSEVAIISGKSTVIEKIYPLINSQFELKALHFAELKSGDLLLKDLSDVSLADINDATAIASSYEHISEFDSLYPGDLEIRKRQISNRITSGEGIHLFIRKDGKIISHGNTAAENSVSAMIGGVMTLEPYRRNHYSKKVVSALCKHLFDQGKVACLFYKGDACANLFHQLGFQDIDQWHILGGIKNE